MSRLARIEMSLQGLHRQSNFRHALPNLIRYMDLLCGLLRVQSALGEWSRRGLAMLQTVIDAAKPLRTPMKDAREDLVHRARTAFPPPDISQASLAQVQP